MGCAFWHHIIPNSEIVDDFWCCKNAKSAVIFQIDFSYTTSGRESRNMYTFVATSEDNNARYRCEATNQISIEPMKAEIVLSVQCKPGFFYCYRKKFKLKLITCSWCILFLCSFWRLCPYTCIDHKAGTTLSFNPTSGLNPMLLKVSG